MRFHSIHSTKIQRNTGNLVEIHSTKFSKGISLNENSEKFHRSQRSTFNATQMSDMTTSYAVNGSS